MRLPPLQLPPVEWPKVEVERWTVLIRKAEVLEAKAGNGDAFERTLAILRGMVASGRFDGLPVLLKRRIAARALTFLWLHDEAVGSRLLNPRLLDLLIEAQQPRLTRITFLQLVQLYFRRFDQLGERDDPPGLFRERLESHLLAQLGVIPLPKTLGNRPDPLRTLKEQGTWLLTLDGPGTLARRAREAGQELAAVLGDLGLKGFDDGRYGDVCRAHFYLETLRHLPVGEKDPVFDELLKPSVSKAPYAGSQRIGHAALEILIDRSGQEPSDAWLSFILSLAGDPRIASSAPLYREWWHLLGEERIQKVRGWLSKEDLRLFLQAVEQYGLETANTEMQRMFPARKRFLEGLFKLKLIRNTRLLLGGKAQQSVRRILGKDVKTSFARMDGVMNDKAVIYLDCGDFHLVEGSHSFKIWVYLAAPGEALRSYERTIFSHSDLTSTIPATYKKLYPSLPYDAFVHTPNTWQSRVFAFLADNGIGLDIEQLLNPEDYRFQLQKFGLPVVNPKRTLVPPPAIIETKPTARFANDLDRFDAAQPKPSRPLPADLAKRSPPPPPAPPSSLAEPSPAARQAKAEGGADTGQLWQTKQVSFSSLQLAALRYLKAHPHTGFYALLEALSKDGGNVLNVKTMLESSLSAFVQQDAEGRWLLSSAGEQVIAQMLMPASASESTTSPAAPAKTVSDTRRIAGLEPMALKVLRYFASNPGDKVRYAANFLKADARVINQALYGPLKGMCAQDKNFGWQLTEAAAQALDAYDEKEQEL